MKNVDGLGETHGVGSAEGIAVEVFYDLQHTGVQSLQWFCVLMLPA